MSTGNVSKDGSVPTVRVGGLETVTLDRKELASLMVEDCMRSRDKGGESLPKLVFSSNGQGLALARQDASFADLMGQADIVHADGMPVVLFSRLTSTPIRQRSATTDFFHDAARASEMAGLKFFILGSDERQNSAAILAMKRMYPRLQIVGSHHGFFDDADDLQVCEMVRSSGADVLWVALGKPRQEQWSVRNRKNLGGVGWVKTCGGLYAFLAGDVPRAPEWMQSLGLEWLYRLMGDPRRLIVRYLLTNPVALMTLIFKTRYRAKS